MKITKVIFSIFFLALLILASGCQKNYPESTQTLEITKTQPMSGSDMRWISVISNKYYFNEKQDDIRPKLEAMINNGKYNVLYVKTSYSSGYLTAAEMAYDASGRGDGNNMRVMFIQSDEHYWNKKQDDIKPRIDAVVNSGKYDIVKINSVYAEGYLLAAEIYYREK
jgi:hypothetical protein